MASRMTLGLLVVALCGALPALAASPAFDAASAFDSLSARVKDIEALGAAAGVSVFSFRLAGMMMASQSATAADFLTTEDLSVAKALYTACNADVTALCADLPAPADSVSDRFHYYAGGMQCLEDNFASVSDSCVASAHAAANYMSAHKDTLRVALKQLAVKDAYTAFTSACAPEVTAQCGNSVITDPSSAVPALAAAAAGGRPHRRLHKGLRNVPEREDRRAGHKHDGSGDEHGPRLDTDAINTLEPALGACASAIAPSASLTCRPALDTLARVALFVTRGCKGEGRRGDDGHREERHNNRALFGAYPPPPPPPSGSLPAPPSDGSAPPPPPPPPSRSWRGSSSGSESDNDDDNNNNQGSWSSHGNKGWGKHHNKKDAAGGVFALVLLVTVVVLTVSACRRRRQVAHLTARLQQLEAAVYGSQQPARAVAVSPPAPQPMMGVPMHPMHVHMHAPPQAQRGPSDAEAEGATLLHTGSVQQGYPGQGYPGHRF